MQECIDAKRNVSSGSHVSGVGQAGLSLPPGPWMIPHNKYAFFIMDDLGAMGIC